MRGRNELVLLGLFLSSPTYGTRYRYGTVRGTHRVVSPFSSMFFVSSPPAIVLQRSPSPSICCIFMITKNATMPFATRRRLLACLIALHAGQTVSGWVSQSTSSSRTTTFGAAARRRPYFVTRLAMSTASDEKKQSASILLAYDASKIRCVVRHGGCHHRSAICSHSFVFLHTTLILSPG